MTLQECQVWCQLLDVTCEQTGLIEAGAADVSARCPWCEFMFGTGCHQVCCVPTYKQVVPVKMLNWQPVVVVHAA
jgi:hypothetical protein